ncbi:MAG TPA: hypothetical protein VM915_11165, partial [Verrucomicrobiae bacterium]|nr:hypothetical protein [Verrucomicrobiae bacterium]
MKKPKRVRSGRSLALRQSTNLIDARLKHVDPEDPRSLRDTIAALYAAISQMPEPLLQDFEAVSEAELGDGHWARSWDIAQGVISIAGGSPAVQLLDAAKVLRALDDLLAELEPPLACDEGADLEALCRTSDGNHYVVPRLTPLDGVEGKPFLRRALLHCRVLPTMIDGFAVRLHPLPGVAGAAEAGVMRIGAPRHYGAALFPGLKVQLA